MAAKTITSTFLDFNRAEAMPATVAVDAADGAVVDFSAASDARILLVLENADASGAKTATIKAGNSIQGVSDLEVSIAASGKMALVVESGAYMNVTGDNKGKVVILGTDTNIKVAAIVLP